MQSFPSTRPVPPESLTKIKMWRDSIIAELRTCGRVGCSEGGGQAAIVDTINFCDQQLGLGSIKENSDKGAGSAAVAERAVDDGVRARSDLSTPEAKSEYIQKFGLQAFEHLPNTYKGPAVLEPDFMCRRDLSQMTPAAKNAFIKEFGLPAFEAIAARREPLSEYEIHLLREKRAAEESEGDGK